MGERTRPATPVLAFTRLVFVAGFSLTIGPGITLFALPDRTADYWAWTIKAPLTAAFMGAGYLGAAVSLFLAARTVEWERVRIVAVAALTLTTVTLVATILEPEPFAFGEGGVTELVAWIWLAVYVGLPPLVLTAFVLQERAGGAREYASELPAGRTTRLVLGCAGVALAAVGLALVAEWSWLVERWAWPLVPLPAKVVGAWLCTYAAGLLWVALRDADWRRFRLGAIAAFVAVGLQLAAAVRLRDGLDGGSSTAVYVVGVVTVLAMLAAAAITEERRLARAGFDSGGVGRRDAQPTTGGGA